VSKPSDQAKKIRARIDPEAYRQRLDRLSKIFAGMVGRADEVSKFRCPYRDRLDRCTAKFSCRNQSVRKTEEAEKGCEHDGNFDYRTAWESKPDSYRRAKEKIRKGSQDAANRRANNKRGSDEV
jgi:hypothetical protein